MSVFPTHVRSKNVALWNIPWQEKILCHNLNALEKILNSGDDWPLSWAAAIREEWRK